MEKFTATCLLLAVVLVLSVSANNGIANEPELADEIAQKEEVIESIPEVEAQPEQETELKEEPIEADTLLPKRFQGDGNFSYASDGETMQMKYENGQIVKLKINGKKIRKEDFHKHHDHVVKLLERTPKGPPTPPTPPNVSWYDADKKISSGEDGMDIFTNGRKSIVTHDEDGNKVIILEDEDGSESKIILKNGIIKIDGEDFEFGTLPDDLEKITLFGDAIIRNDDIDLSIPELAYVLPDLAEIPEIPEMPEMDFVMPEMPPFPEINFDELNFNFDTLPPGSQFKNKDGSIKYYNDLNEEEQKEIREELREAKEAYQEAMREYRETQKEAMKDYREQLAETRQEQKEAMREMKEGMQKVRELALENQQEAMKEARELAKEARERSREAREEGMAIAREHRNQAHRRNNVWKKSFEQQMRNDGFIDRDGDYDFRMKHNSLKINGQQQSNAMLDKYIQLYEEATGKSLGDRFSIKIKNDGSNQSTSISIDN